MGLFTTTDENVVFEGQLSKYGRLTTNIVTINFEGNKFLENSFWLQTLNSLKFCTFVNSSNFRTFATIFPVLIANPITLKILQEPLESLTSERINFFFSLLDDEIDKRPIKERSKYKYSHQVKIFFARPDLKIIGGGTTESCYRATKPRFYAGRHRPMLNELTNRASQTSFENLEELNASIREQYQQKIDFLRSACMSDIQQHLLIVEDFIRLKQTHLSDESERKIRYNKDLNGSVRTKVPPDPFHMNARVIEICNIKNFSSYHKFKEKGGHFCRSNGASQCRFYVTTRQRNIIPRSEVWLCDLFLPRRILLACLICLQLATGANVSTLMTLTRDRVKKISADKYTIIGIKTKTDKEIKLEITKRNDPLAYQAIELLLKHDFNIEKYWQRNNQSIFSSISTRGQEIFDLYSLTKLKDRWIIWHSAPYFAFDDLRDLVAQNDYLGHKDPFRVQALLQHTNVAITDDYIESNIIAILRAANINEFMRRLAPSIAYTVDKKAAAKGFDSNKIDENLLFPVSKFGGVTEAICDKWLMSESGINFTIDEAAVIHCAYQRSYYLRYFDGLISANEDKFYRYHLPRIIFCLALYKLIEQSDYKYLLKESAK